MKIYSKNNEKIDLLSFNTRISLNSSHTTGTDRLITFLMEAKNGSGLGVAIKGFFS